MISVSSIRYAPNPVFAPSGPLLTTGRTISIERTALASEQQSSNSLTFLLGDCLLRKLISILLLHAGFWGFEQNHSWSSEIDMSFLNKQSSNKKGRQMLCWSGWYDLRFYREDWVGKVLGWRLVHLVSLGIWCYRLTKMKMLRSITHSITDWNGDDLAILIHWRSLLLVV